MKSMKKILKHYREGFSLVELMIVVAIIGVLAAIAVPNYTKYQARSRQAEGRTMLSNSYAALKSYAGEANNGGTFSACLGKLGGTPEIGARRFYAYGFSNGTVGNTCGQDGATDCHTFTYKSNNVGVFVADLKCGGVDAGFSTAVNTSDLNFGANSTIVTAQKMGGADLNLSVIKMDKFTIHAKGFISDTGVGDEWTADQDKRIINNVSGI